MRRSEPPLHVRGAGQRRIPDDVADGINVRHARLEILIDVQIASLIGNEVDLVEPPCRRCCPCGRSPTKTRPSSIVCSGLQVQDHAVFLSLDFFVFLAMADQDASSRASGYAKPKRIGDLVVEKLQQLVPRVDQVDLDPQVAKHRRVLATNNAGPVNRDRAAE